MPCLLIEARRRIIWLYSCGSPIPSVFRRLEEEKVAVSKHAVYNLVKKFCLKGVIKDLARQKRARILMEQMKLFIEEERKKNDKVTSTALYASLRRNWPDLTVSASMIKCVQREM